MDKAESKQQSHKSSNGRINLQQSKDNPMIVHKSSSMMMYGHNAGDKSSAQISETDLKLIQTEQARLQQVKQQMQVLESKIHFQNFIELPPVQDNDQNQQPDSEYNVLASMLNMYSQLAYDDEVPVKQQLQQIFENCGCADYLKPEQQKECMSYIELQFSLKNSIKEFVNQTDMFLLLPNKMQGQIDELTFKLQQAENDHESKLHAKDEEIQQLKQQILLSEKIRQEQIENQKQIEESRPQDTQELQQQEKLSQLNDQFGQQVQEIMQNCSQIVKKDIATNIETLLNQASDSVLAMQQENMLMSNEKQKATSKLYSLQQNIKFLESKLSELMTENKENSIKLKSEIVIYKQKAKGYKQKLRQEVQNYETHKMRDMNQIIQTKEQNAQGEISQLQVKLETQQKIAEDLKEVNDQLKKDLKELERKFKQEIGNRDFEVDRLSRQVHKTETKHQKKLIRLDNLREETQKKLNIEERQGSLNTLKLDYLINNQKKMLLHKKFLEEQIDKDLEDLALEMKRGELEMRKDGLINANQAIVRLNNMYSSISDSLKYVRKIINFMDFEHDKFNNIGLNVNFDEKELPLKEDFVKQEKEKNNSRQQDKHNDTQNQTLSSNRNNQTAKDGVDQTQYVIPIEEFSIKDFSIDSCYNKFIYELSEVLLTILCEYFKDTNTILSADLIKLLDMFQNQTDKLKVQQIYQKFFAQNRIHFSQYLFKLNEKNQGLLQEKRLLKKQLKSLQKEMLNQQDSDASASESGKKTDRIDSLNPVSQTVDQQDFTLNARDLKDMKLSSTQQPNQNFSQTSNSNTNAAGTANFSQSQQQQQQQTTMQNQAQSAHTTHDFSNSNNTSQIHGGHQQIFDSNTHQQEPTHPGQGGHGSQGSHHHGHHHHGHHHHGNHGHQQQQQQAANAQSSVPQAKSHLETKIAVLEQENEALKERLKHVRLKLQRKITQLQDKYDDHRKLHFQEINSLKIQYGKDLKSLDKKNQEKQDLAIENYKNLKQNDFDTQKQDAEDRIQAMQADYEAKFRIADQKKQQAEDDMNMYRREILKIKKEQAQWFHGGEGSFAIVFEKHQPDESTMARKSKKGGNTLQRGASSHRDSVSAESLRQLFSDQTPRQQGITLEQIEHFIEVGFMIDSISFRHIQTYTEWLYDRLGIQKFLFEFQDPVDNQTMINLEAKIKQQVTENFALFNEINPIYVTINMGRAITPFSQDSISQSNFKLIKREGQQLNNSHMMVNFLISEQKQFDVRIIAFDTASFIQYGIDLSYKDILLIVEGNMRLLDEDCQQDLCQILLNNLTIINRKRTNKDKKQENFLTLAVEHKIFFNERYQAAFEPRNKLIMAKYNKRRQGLVRDVENQTEFQKSIVYEYFESVYSDEVFLCTNEIEGIGQVLQLDIERGTMSGHLKMKVSIPGTEIEQELCLYSSQSVKQKRSQQMSSEIIIAPQQYSDNVQHEEPLAYIFSLENIYGQEDVLVVRICQINKLNPIQMTEFKWKPHNVPYQGSTSQFCETIYLVKRNDQMYTRILDYEILNTELRSLLFTFTYGYPYKSLDFSSMIQRAVQSQAFSDEHQGLQNMMQLDITIKQPAMVLDMMGDKDLIFRDYCIVRVRQETGPKLITNFDTQPSRLNQLNKSGDMQESHLHTQPNFEHDMDQEQNQQDEKDYEIKTHYALVTLMKDDECLERNQIWISIVIKNEEISVNKFMLVDVPQDNLKYNEAPIQKIFDKAFTYELSLKVIDQIVLTQYFKNDDEGEEYDDYIINVDSESEPLRDVFMQIKQHKIQQLNELHKNSEGQSNYKINMDIEDFNSQVPIDQLAQCPKVSQMGLINKQPYKITATFLNALKNYTCKVPKGKKLFSFAAIVLEAYSRQQDQKLYLRISQTDINNILAMLEEKLVQERAKTDFLKDQPLVHKDMSKTQLLDFIIDCLTIETENNILQISVEQLHLNIVERIKLKEWYTLQGGRFLNRENTEDPELAMFQSSLPQTELSKKLIINIEKDLHDKKFDIKIYECKLQSMPETSKVQLEVFWVEQPQIVFRTDFLCEKSYNGKKVLIERFNIIEQLYKNFEESKFVKDALVLSFSENSFPHTIDITLLEPCSHIQWKYQYKDDKFNNIIGRRDKYNFVVLLKDVIDYGLLRGVVQNFVTGSAGVDKPYKNNESQIIEVEQAQYQKALVQDSDKEIYLYRDTLSKLSDLADADEEMYMIYGQNIRITNGVYEEITLLTDRALSQLIIQITDDNTTLGLTKNTKSETKKLYICLQTQRQASRIIQGIIEIGTQHLFYTVELSSGFTVQEKAFRVTLNNSKTKDQIISIVFAENNLLDKEQEKNKQANFKLKEDTKFAFTTGYQDSQQILDKLDDLQEDLRIYDIQQIPLSNIQIKEKSQQEILQRKIIQKDGHDIILTTLKEVINPSTMMSDSGDISNRSGQPNLIQKIKIMLYNSTSSHEEQYQFNLEDILSLQEQQLLQNPSDCSDIINFVLENRLQIKTILDNDEKNSIPITSYSETNSFKENMGKSILSQLRKKMDQTRYVLFFTNPDVLPYKPPKTQRGKKQESNMNIVSPKSRSSTKSIGFGSKGKANTVKLGVESGSKRREILSSNKSHTRDNIKDPMEVEEYAEFDIRRQFNFSIFSQDPTIMSQIEDKPTNVFYHHVEPRLLYQFEREDFLFDVLEEVDPYQLALIIRAHTKHTFKLIKQLRVTEDQIQTQLQKDNKLHFLEPQRREALCQYLTANLHMDEDKQNLYFMKQTLD